MPTRYAGASELKALYGITDKHLAAVAEVGPALIARVPDLVESFYDWLKGQREYAVFFSDPHVLQHVKDQQTRYWQEFLVADISESYVAKRRAVGIAHARIGLPAHSYLASINFFLRHMVRELECNGASPDGAQHGFRVAALAGLAQLDAGIALDAIAGYHAESFERVAAGDYSADYQPRYDGDVFGTAVAHLTRTLRDVELLSEKIAAGDTDVSVVVRGELDRLGRALGRMVENQRTVAEIANAVAGGDYSVAIPLRSPKDKLGKSLQAMTQNLAQFHEEKEQQVWLAQGLAGLGEMLRGDHGIEELGQRVVTYLCQRVGAPMGALYALNQGLLRFSAGYAMPRAETFPSDFRLGEGLVGQAALDRRTIALANLPSHYARVRSGTGEAVPTHLLVVPLVHDERVTGVLEIATLSALAPRVQMLVEKAGESISVALKSAWARQRVEELLVETQHQAEALLLQREELQRTNEELEQQAESLRQSEEESRAQQEELELTNQELEEKTQALERQKQVLEQVTGEIRAKSRQLEEASRYKSEFLANMSHELRTPLNSLLLLARLLLDNQDGNLTAEQLESLTVIHRSGTDLLNLINDILDLSKVEAGKMAVVAEAMDVPDFLAGLRHQFKAIADDRRLGFSVQIADGGPTSIVTDRGKVEQLLRNLLSNAFKFTHEGLVSVTVRHVDGGVDGATAAACYAVAMDVADTGIGVPEDKRQLIFEAFQQADGTTSRRYGGTGLGLSICRQFAQLLGGEIAIKSEVGRGSTFTLYLPATIASETAAANARAGRSAPPAAIELPAGSAVALHQLSDRVDQLRREDRVLLIIEDDARFARILCDLARSYDFKCLVASDGRNGFAAAKQYLPAAVLLDIGLPDVDGWSVMDQLKRDPDLRHIPVHCVSANGDAQAARSRGAIGYLAKPVTKDELLAALGNIEAFIKRRVAHLLVFRAHGTEDADRDLAALFADAGVEVTTTHVVAEAVERVRGGNVDCLILEVAQSGVPFALLGEIAADSALPKPPVVVYTESMLTEEESRRLAEYRARMVIRDAMSKEALLDDVTLFLHSVVSRLPEQHQRVIRRRHLRDENLEGKSVLVVDDDMRNLYALSSALRARGLQVIMAENGAMALEKLAQEQPVHLVVMDIMMPVMDGYDAIKAIRAKAQWAELPILALTAKALAGDRERCLEAGANDYLAKPVDLERLLSMMRVWLQH